MKRRTDSDLPRNYNELLLAGYSEGKKDFQIMIGNLGRLEECLLAAPHGGGIEPGTSEIVRATALIGGRAFYVFEGTCRRGNRPLHIDSTGFDEPRLLEIVPRCDFVLSIHGAQGAERWIYVGGLYERGRQLAIAALNAGLASFGIATFDATKEVRGQGISGLDPRNLTNRGRRGQGLQLEFTEGARRVFFPDLNSRMGRRSPTQALAVLAASIDRVVEELIGH